MFQATIVILTILFTLYCLLGSNVAYQWFFHYSTLPNEVDTQPWWKSALVIIMSGPLAWLMMTFFFIFYIIALIIFNKYTEHLTDKVEEFWIKFKEL